MSQSLITKYNVPGPRYTSYPTVPYWETSPNEETWKQHVKKAFMVSGITGAGLSLYIHLPYCEKLCTYCGCNKRITINHKVEEPYIETLLKEWKMYLELFGEKPLIKETHLGGGTPTFFSPENLKILIEGILEASTLADQPEMSFEGHPNNTTEDHLQTLYDLGFRRVSFGIQDFDEKVQRVIHRIQPYENVERVTMQAKKIGYTSINFDLIYGLPLQTLDSIINTIEKVKILQPDRIAFYSYAHVPWTSPGQRSYTEADLPKNEEKRKLYETGKALLEEAGYMEIGMDHFSKTTDELYIASQNRSLYRNFMGYSASPTGLLIGLGASSISDTWTAFGQNLKKIEDYKAAVNEGKFPVFRGHILTDEDLIIRQHILNLMCTFHTHWDEEGMYTPALLEGLERLTDIEKDGLIEISETKITVHEAGKPFIRNICMALDAKLWRNQPETQLFSSTV
ncbi:oxygen-independent coproporphyrinogen III oxidase [Litoribacter alkaliphilus]|uniref:Coproporphyrinogen-III oxidase n=1 Tax=Litoribacter ruber TaxID=702568 RepID=A0AAP2CEX4_9BACT|nr:oxygen-independent coproporphyrinogen III oxidase [Litoribacter alkaliphilus]MBS9523291.1 oxygen-independent coproporphyrinogen III oxidase [Litoribacter alkaliphilus]